MSIASPESVIRPVSRTARRAERIREHRFFTLYMVLLAIVIFLGFAPSFYMRGIMPSFAPLRPLRFEVIVHGLLAGTYVLMFPFQAWLIATRRREQHIRVGHWGFALGFAMIPLGYYVAVTNYHAMAGVPLPPTVTPAAIAAAPLMDLAALSILLWVAWAQRFEGKVHKRLMVLIACGLADPAISRLPLWGGGVAGAVQSSLVMFATVLPLWVWDLSKRGRLHWATVLGSLLLGGKLVLRFSVSLTDAWAQFVASMPGFGAL